MNFVYVVYVVYFVYFVVQDFLLVTLAPGRGKDRQPAGFSW